jgi:hypothetical protein
VFDCGQPGTSYAERAVHDVAASYKEIPMTRAGDKVTRDTATQNQSKVHLGESAPIFRPIRSGEKVVRDTATTDQGKVRLGESAPVFVRPIRAGDKVVRDATSQDQGKVRLGESSPAF